MPIALHVSSSGSLRLTFIPVDNDKLGIPVAVDVHQSTLVSKMHDVICDHLRQTTIGQHYRSPLPILPLERMPPEDHLNTDLANLRMEAQQPDALPKRPVVEFFNLNQQHSEGVHFLVWLPPEDREFL